MNVSQLGLRGVALQAAWEFSKRYPGTVFTSGRRSVTDQARAMASNAAVNRKWIEQTYKKPLCAAAKACQAWVDANPIAKTKEQIAAGLEAVLKTFSDAELAKLSCHLSGDAFDVEPDGMTEKDEYLNELATKHGGKFLDKEGGLKRRHWQARP